MPDNENCLTKVKRKSYLMVYYKLIVCKEKTTRINRMLDVICVCLCADFQTKLQNKIKNRYFLFFFFIHFFFYQLEKY